MKIVWMRLGFAIGLVSSVIYILIGGNTWLLFTPIWARILFYPGFITGSIVYNRTSGEFVSEAVGCLTVSFTYALIFGFIFLIYSRFSRNH